MKKVVLVVMLVGVFFACTNQSNKQTQTEEPKSAEVEQVVLTVDDLYEKAGEVVDNEIVVKGTVMHVCQHGGQRCFIMGSNEDINIRIEAGEDIGSFSQELMGSEIEVVGLLKEVKTEADAHNPDHGEEEGHAEDEETKEAHRIIAEAQEAAEVVYFITGVKYKEL